MEFDFDTIALQVCADKLRLRSASIHLTISLHVACKGCNSICLFIRLRSLMIIFLSSRSSHEVSSKAGYTELALASISAVISVVGSGAGHKLLYRPKSNLCSIHVVLHELKSSMIMTHAKTE